MQVAIFEHHQGNHVQKKKFTFSETVRQIGNFTTFFFYNLLAILHEATIKETQLQSDGYCSHRLDLVMAMGYLVTEAS